MDLMPWKPSGEITSLRREMDNLWNRFFGETVLPRFVSKNGCPQLIFLKQKTNFWSGPSCPAWMQKTLMSPFLGIF
jgi:hypothetical protein